MNKQYTDVDIYVVGQSRIGQHRSKNVDYCYHAVRVTILVYESHCRTQITTCEG